MKTMFDSIIRQYPILYNYIITNVFSLEQYEIITLKEHQYRQEGYLILKLIDDDALIQVSSFGKNLFGITSEQDAFDEMLQVLYQSLP